MMGETEIDEALVSALLREQHPDLAGLQLQKVADGWDNQMWRLGEELAVRMPRTPRAPSLLRTEQRWLPVLAARLPLPAGTAPRFFDAYANTDSATIQRTRGWAVLRALHLMSIGRNGKLGLPGGKPAWELAGRAALERILATS